MAVAVVSLIKFIVIEPDAVLTSPEIAATETTSPTMPLFTVTVTKPSEFETPDVVFIFARFSSGSEELVVSANATVAPLTGRLFSPTNLKVITDWVSPFAPLTTNSVIVELPSISLLATALIAVTEESLVEGSPSSTLVEPSVLHPVSPMPSAAIKKYVVRCCKLFINFLISIRFQISIEKIVQSPIKSSKRQNSILV